MKKLGYLTDGEISASAVAARLKCKRSKPCRRVGVVLRQWLHRMAAGGGGKVSAESVRLIVRDVRENCMRESGPGNKAGCKRGIELFVSELRRHSPEISGRR